MVLMVLIPGLGRPTPPPPRRSGQPESAGAPGAAGRGSAGRAQVPREAGGPGRGRRARVQPPEPPLRLPRLLQGRGVSPFREFFRSH